ncbi:MAG: M14 family zinc carboxypeptidase, partial [Candidatus Acidiferrales bacterium]
MLLAGSVAAQEFEYFPGAKYDQAIPTLKQVVGHVWGEKITMHHEAERYLKALDEASPRARLEQHGATWEGRTLYHLIIASEQNMARLDQIKAAIQKLADPRKTNDSEADGLMRDLPAVTWLAYGVHGNEISSPDAALLTAYHLLAAQNDPVVQQILDQSIVILDPMQNPDGRDRFINYFRGTTGRWPDGDPQAAEHNETWPSGRVNHYLFDMNRDWFAHTQPETRGRAKA